MVQEYVSPLRVHKYPFEMVMAAYERRFPNCPQIPVVLECVITDDSWSADDSQRHTTRRCQLNVEAPYLLKKMIGVDYIYFIQKNHLDLKGRVLEIEATNETFASRVEVVEKCRYFVHPENSDWTCFEQKALLDVKNFFGLENTIEKIAIKQYASNIAKGKELIESFMKEVHADGVTELKQWSGSDPEHNLELRRIVSRGTEPLSPRAAAEPKRHSQPGTSGIIPILNKSSHKLLKSRSNIFKRNTPSTSHIPVTKSKGILSTGDLSKKSSQNLSRARHKSEERIDDSPKKLKSISKLFGRSKTDLKSRDSKEEFREEKKRVTLSQPNLRISSDDSFMPSSDSKALLLGKMKPCECPPSSQGTVSEFFGRWDSLLVVLVCVMVILLSMTAPLSLYFSRRRSS